MTTMSKLSLVVLATIAAVSPIAVVAGSGVARADIHAGDQCYIWHVTAQDASGRTMWCNHTMTGTHSLVWQYGGPSDILGP
jgi:hypothetical protein